MSKVKQNLIFQTVYQVLIVITPLITSPYVSRVLGAEGLGVYSYTNSISNYFLILAMLGTNTYGSKTIATVRDSRKERSYVFVEIMAMQIFLSIFGMAVYTGYMLKVNQDHLLVSCIQMLMITSCMFNVNWFFFGLEKFKTTVTRNIIIKLFTIASIFLFVREKDDLWKYVLIMAGGEVLSQLILFVMARRYVTFYRPTLKGILRHLKPNLILFVPGIAFALNHDLDKTMIGIFSDYQNSGCYYNAEKLIKIPTGIITGIGVVMLPHITSMVAKGEEKKNEVFLRNSLSMILFFAVALCGGIISICKEFVPVFFGPGYDACVLLINIMAVSIIFKTIANIIRTQYLIPHNKEKEYSIIVLTGAGINCIMNILMIPRAGAEGAAVATMIAECLVCIGHVYVIEKDLTIIRNLLKCLIYLIPAGSMYGVVRMFAADGGFTGIGGLITEILLGGMTYLIIGLPCLMVINQTIWKGTKLEKVIHNPCILFVYASKFYDFSILPDEIYLKLLFRGMMDQKLDLEDPKTFNEKLQWLKLYDRNPEYTRMVDKYEVRGYIKDTIGEKYLIPCLGVWDCFEEIPFDQLPERFVLKCTHDSHSVIICKDKSRFEKDVAKKKLTRALKHNYFYEGRQWPYKDVKPRILAEAYMEESQGGDLKDYKVHVFHGVPEIILVCSSRFAKTGLQEDFFDTEWNHLDIRRPAHPNGDGTLEKPVHFEEMLEIAKKLAGKMAFARIDFYDDGKRLYFGEITMYPASGMSPFIPEEWDRILGEKIELGMNKN
ncbi:hypothetical protein BHF69_08540 [Anaerostipes sp. 992a]|uniref:ATP-grasp fold amidoligase family protein n=1 Tax=Anaerostipes sp. 992a TaxID=1261637 RepID=UPI000952B0A4|nr:ATP-grasp fold amidoligase family protein [Anaerostipes sp. 992a]OLR62720.1 hypothetical protein BHF69_08540 [Anaerostipes sp. 992a]